MKNNIEAFNVAVAEVFGTCYQAFPVRIDLSVIELGDAILQANGDDGPDIDLRKPEYEIARESINWLVEAGYLWRQNYTGGESLGVTLSPKGLEVMNAIPEELQSHETVGEQLSKGVKELGKEAALDIVKTSLAQGIKLLINA